MCRHEVAEATHLDAAVVDALEHDRAAGDRRAELAVRDLEAASCGAWAWREMDGSGAARAGASLPSPPKQLPPSYASLRGGFRRSARTAPKAYRYPSPSSHPSRVYFLLHFTGKSHAAYYALIGPRSRCLLARSRSSSPLYLHLERSIALVALAKFADHSLLLS